MPLGRQGPIAKLVTGGIGLTKEYQADRNARKAAASGAHQPGSEEEHPRATGQDRHHATGEEHEHGYDDEDEDDEDDIDEEKIVQDLDAAQAESAPPLTPSADEEGGGFDEKNWMDKFVRTHPPPSPWLEQPLELPVIMPSRRPGHRSRGFVRAYAEELQTAGIDARTWVDFLDGLDKSMAGHKWFHAVNAAVFVVEKVRTLVSGVSLIASLVTKVVHVSIEAGRRGYQNTVQNKFMDRMNDEFFKPRGLFAMIVTYDPKSDDPEAVIDAHSSTTQKVAKRDDEAEHRSKWKSMYEGTAGKTQHEEEIPEFAPLVFPQLDTLSEQQKESSIKHFGSFLTEYYDRRGQARWDYTHDTSNLAGVTGEKQFASRYSDPNSQASRGGLVSTLTGGTRVGVLGRLGQRRQNLTGKLRDEQSVGKDGKAKAKGRSKRPMKRFLNPNAVYLMVVNMPPREELEAALLQLEAASKEKGAMFDMQAMREKLGLGSSKTGGGERMEG